MKVLRGTFSRATWDRLAGPGFCPLPQSWDYGAAMALLGAGLARVQLAGEADGAAQVLLRRGLALCSRGPLWATPPASGQDRAALRALARAFAPRLFLANAERPVQGFGLLPLLTPRHHALWDLAPSELALRAGLSGKWRNRLVKAESARPRLFFSASPAEQAALWAAESAQRAARGYRALPQAFFAAWEVAGGQSLWVLAPGLKGDGPSAGMLFLCHGTSATYQMGYASPEARAAFLHGPMLWQAALRLKAQGIRWLDLGDLSDAAPGLAHFKIGTGARVQPLGPTLWVLPSLSGA